MFKNRRVEKRKEKKKWNFTRGYVIISGSEQLPGNQWKFQEITSKLWIIGFYMDLTIQTCEVNFRLDCWYCFVTVVYLCPPISSPWAKLS